MSASRGRRATTRTGWAASASGGANALWLAEWLAAAIDLRPGMRVLDLGCGRAMSSVSWRRELGGASSGSRLT